jgi:hypothetical protein
MAPRSLTDADPPAVTGAAIDPCLIIRPFQADAVVLQLDPGLLADRDRTRAVYRRIRRLGEAGVHVAVVAAEPDVGRRFVARPPVRPGGPGKFLVFDDAPAWHLAGQASGPPDGYPEGPDGYPDGQPSGYVTWHSAGHLLASGSGDTAAPAPTAVPRPRAAEADTRAVVTEALRRLGVHPALALWLDGRTALLPALDEQVRQRARRRVPQLPADPAWTVMFSLPGGRPSPAQESLFTIGDGSLATRGGTGPGSSVLAAGVYTGRGRQERLLAGPGWTGLPVDGVAHPQRYLLDLRGGVLLCEERDGDFPLRSLRFASVERPGVQALRAEAAGDRLGRQPALTPPDVAGPQAGVTRIDRDGGRIRARTSADGPGGIAAVAVQRVRRTRPVQVLERLAAYRADPCRVPDPEDADQALMAAAEVGFDGLLAEQRQAWARRWATVDVEIPGDESAQLALRYALFQLWTNIGRCGEGTGRPGEHAAGARGLSGPDYAGHVFWDADVHCLPAVATIDPAAARAMLEYRIRRLPAARERARARGLTGACFPWESARDGHDVTPPSILLGDLPADVRTGELEEHIVADVAWATDHFATWTGEPGFLYRQGRPLIEETAAYWASRIRRGDDGLAHIDGVIGPDEYHESVDDDMFTNVMARRNLRRAAALLGPSATARSWLDLAGALVTGYDPVVGRHEQFVGYDGLEPMRAADLGRVPVAADVVLGPARLAGTQLIKQPDVLMAHLLIPEDLPEGSLSADLDHYLPRTTHGSSLSPAVSAAVLARAGRTGQALDLLRMALRLDLDDLVGSTGRGLHLATIGGTWWALVAGFAGLSVRGGVLRVDPRLPDAWDVVRLSLRCLGARLRLEVGHDHLRVVADRRVRVQVGSGTGGGSVTAGDSGTAGGSSVVGPGGRRWRRGGVGWLIAD